MVRTIEQPVTASVIRWAIAESGFTLDELDAALEVQPGTVRTWARGDDRPSWTLLQKLAAALKRQVSVFFLPEPPKQDGLSLSFRAPPKSQRKKANPTELRYIREARRIQRVLSWLKQQSAGDRVELPRVSLNSPAPEQAKQIRTMLRVTNEQQCSWPNHSIAFDSWRTALEDLGIHVFLFSLGSTSSKGFSLWDDYAPLVAANTHWNESARIFTLFHEVGHLVTRTSSICPNPAEHVHISHGDTQERWCENFAAATLIPSDALVAFLQVRFKWRSSEKISSIEQAKAISNHFNVSVRAAALRTIDIGAATWDLYASIPAIFDNKPKGGGGSGRLRHEAREDTYGPRTTSMFITGIKNELVTPYDAMTYLKVSDRDIDAWQNRPAQGGTEGR